MTNKNTFQEMANQGWQQTGYGTISYQKWEVKNNDIDHY